MNAMVEPLPLVPATWITGGSLRSGWPSAAEQPPIRSSDRSIRFGCSVSSRATMASIAHALRSAIGAGAQRCRCGSRGSGRFDRRRRCRRRLGQEPAQPREVGAQLVAVDHHVDHAVVPEIFGALKAFRQLLADGLLDDARPGEADQRAGFGDLDIAEHGVGRGDAAGGRIGEHHDVGLLGLAQHLHGDRRARQLHQRQDALLHARAARCREHDEGRAALDRSLQARDHRLAGRHAERAAHEIEILHRGDDRHAVHLPAPTMTASGMPVLARASLRRSV